MHCHNSGPYLVGPQIDRISWCSGSPFHNKSLKNSPKLWTKGFLIFQNPRFTASDVLKVYSTSLLWILTLKSLIVYMKRKGTFSLVFLYPSKARRKVLDWSILQLSNCATTLSLGAGHLISTSPWTLPETKSLTAPMENYIGYLSSHALSSLSCLPLSPIQKIDNVRKRWAAILSNENRTNFW